MSPTSTDYSPPWYLGIDLGTGGLKVGAIAADGRMMASAFRSIDSVVTPDGGNEQDPQAWCVALVSASREVTEIMVPGHDGPQGTCRGVGITGQWGSTVPVDSEGRADVLHQMASIPGLRRGSYLIANNHETGGATLRWLRDGVLRADDGLGQAPDDYDAITAAASRSMPGAGGVIYTPWLKGERSPVENPHLRASFLNMSIDTTRADLIRSVLEGVAYNARWLLEATESFAGRSLDGLRLFGGGAKSDLWAQIHADVIGRPIVRLDDSLDVNVRGAAWFAALSLGHLTEEPLARTPPPSTVFSPNPSAGLAYRPLYAEFTRLARAQRSMFKRLNRS